MHRAVRSATAALASLLPLLGLAAVATPAAAATPDSLVINEVEQDGSPSDWIELYNTSAEPVDASGLVLRDDNDPEQSDEAGDKYVLIPSGTVIAGHGFFAMDTGDMGLGKGGDMARLFTPEEGIFPGTGDNPISAFEWTSEVDTTWGSCPDGSGDVVETTAPTKGGPNDCPAAPGADDLVINEVEADDAAGGPDWVELYNTGDTALDISGWVFADDSKSAVLSDGTIVPAHGYLVLNGEDGAPEDFGFGLGKGGDEVHLYLPDGATSVDDFTWDHEADETFGRCPDGIGDFVDTDGPTPGAPNACPLPAGAGDIVINEVESKDTDSTVGGGPDWIELYNMGDTDVNVTGWLLRDDDPDHLAPIPAGKIVPAHGYLVLENTDAGGAGDFDFGLGNPDEVHLYTPDDVEVDQLGYTDHARTTLGRCPDGTGEFAVTFEATKGGPNACSDVRINEIESDGGDPGDWVELINTGDQPADVSGMIIKDSEDDHTVTISAGTTIAPHEFFVVEVGEAGVGLGGGDSVRLFDASGEQLLDSYTWSEHAATTYGRCPDGFGEFQTTLSPTKGAPNHCAGTTYEPWPGGEEVTTVDDGSYEGDMSGLVYEPSGRQGERGTLWAANNKRGLYKLVWDGTDWVPAAGAWADARTLTYTDGSGTTDSEGLTFGGPTSASGVYVATERNNDADDVSRPSILRYDVASAAADAVATGGPLVATDEWSLAGILPANLGANSGPEGVTWVPDSILTAGGLIDESTGDAYDPASYSEHSDGVFFVAVEGTAEVYGVVLQADHTVTLVATLDPGLDSLADVTFDPETGDLWAVCDDSCQGRSVVFDLATAGPFAGTFQVAHRYDNPVGMGDSLANEGMAITANELCVDGRKPVVYADDAGTDGHALREGTIDCEIQGTDPGTTDPGTSTPADDDASPDVNEHGLAETGADMPWFLPAAVLLVIVGAALLMVAARRRGSRARSAEKD